MSSEAEEMVRKLDRIRERLESITAELSEGETDDQTAAGLAAEAAELTAEAAREAGSAVDRLDAD